MNVVNMLPEILVSESKGKGEGEGKGKGEFVADHYEVILNDDNKKDVNNTITVIGYYPGEQHSVQYKVNFIYNRKVYITRINTALRTCGIPTIPNSNRHGLYETYYPNGEPKLVCYYDDGVLNGSYNEYYDNGNIKVKCNYVNGKICGHYTTYHSNGVKSCHCTHERGLKYGVETVYRENGEEREQWVYTKGKISFYIPNY